jgi:AraC-like DNA-binding protein
MFEYFMSDETCHLKYAQGKPAVTGKEFHSYDEIVLFLEGDAQLISKNIQIRLTPGSIIMIPREHFHQFVVGDHQNYRRCILGFEEIPALQLLIREVLTEVMVLPTPPKQMHSVFKTLIQAVQYDLPECERTLLFHSSLAQLVLIQKLSGSESIRTYVTVSKLTQEALDYIDNHLSQELKLAHIAEHLGVSVSTLSHRFQEDLRISVYRYISEKRLSSVRQCMQQGMPLGIAAAQCGFKDYSGFFRMYKNYYGESPSTTARMTRIKS